MEGQADPEFDYEDARRELGARGATGACPFCGGRKWGDLGELGNLLVTLPAATSTGDIVFAGGQLGGISAFALTCSNCGFVRLHAERILSDTNRRDERS